MTNCESHAALALGQDAGAERHLSDLNRVIPGRLGKGASQVAVLRNGKAVAKGTDFPLTAGWVMSTRSGNTEPGLLRTAKSR
jgi:acetate kinase